MTRERDDTGAEPTALQTYWDELAARHAAGDHLAAVCYPGAPSWFNRFAVVFQLRTVARLLAGVPIAGARVLDVGCGSGRWSRWLAARGAEVVGIDPTAAMLDAARRLSGTIDFRRMSATQIELPAASFDLVVAITVIQHLRPTEQEQAAASMSRVLRSQGHLLVVDLIDRRDPGHTVSPRTPRDWIALYERHGWELVRWSGYEYMPLLRLLIALARWYQGPPKGVEVERPTLIEQTGRHAWAFQLLRPVVWLSYPIELACEALLPRTWARHGAFLFRKR